MKKTVLIVCALLLFGGTLFSASPWVQEGKGLIRDMTLTLRKVNNMLERARSGAEAGRALATYIDQMMLLVKRAKSLEKKYPQVKGTKDLMAAQELVRDPVMLMYQKEIARYAKLMGSMIGKYASDPAFMAAFQKAAMLQRQ